MNKHIVRHEDGKTSTRNSAGNKYPYAIEVGPADLDMAIASEIAVAQARFLTAQSARDAFIDSDQKVSIRRKIFAPRYSADTDKDLGYTGEYSYTNYEYITADGKSWGYCDSNGDTEPRYGETESRYSKISIKAWILARLDEDVNRTQHALTRAQELTHETVRVERSWSVVTWCGRYDLAQKQLDKWSKICARTGNVVRIVETQPNH